MSMKYLVFVVLLAGCGGSSDTTQTSPPPSSTPTSLSGSAGDLTKYLGAWQSGCGTNIVQRTSVINVFSFTQASGVAVTGTLSSTPYNSLDCSGSPSTILGLPNTTQVSLNYVSSVSVVSSGTGSSGFTGTADYLVMSYAGTTNTMNAFVGFKANSPAFILTTTGTFSQFDLTYTKR